MPRLARAIAIGCAHHITQRGNNRQDVFFVDDDRRVYLELLQEQAQKYGLEVLAYCLMTNHVHLVAISHEEEALAQAIGRTHFRYTQYINRLHRRSGHLWQGRFYSCALDGRHLWLAIKYVELNPVRAKLCRTARGYCAKQSRFQGRRAGRAHRCWPDSLALRRCSNCPAGGMSLQGWFPAAPCSFTGNISPASCRPLAVRNRVPSSAPCGGWRAPAESS